MKLALKKVIFIHIFILHITVLLSQSSRESFVELIEQRDLVSLETMITSLEKKLQLSRKDTLLSCFSFYNECSDISTLKFLLKQGFIPPNSTFTEEYDILFLAITCEDLEFVKLIIDKLEPHQKKEHFREPILLALEKGDVKLTKYLIEKGYSVNVKDDYSAGILYSAVRGGNLELVKYSLEHNDNICDKGISGGTALDIAIIGGHDSIVNYFLTNFSCECIHKRSLLWGISSLNINSYLNLKDKSTSSFQPFLGSQGENILQYVISKGKIAITTLEYLDSIDVDFLHLDYAGNTALFYCKDESLDYADFLLNKGLDINQMDYEGNTYLKTRHDNLRKYLVLTSITKGIIDEYMSIDHFLPFLEMISFLMKNGAYVNEQGDGDRLLKQLLTEMDRVDIWEYYDLNLR